MEAVQAALAARGLDALRVELLLAFAALYTLPALLMVALTAGPRRRMAASREKDKDASAVQVVRLTNRAIASTAMFTLPAVVVARNLAVWSPWSGGAWCSPLDPLQTVLLHMQLMYYVMDTPYTLLKRDAEQIVHHAIGFGLALPTVRMGKCGLPMCAVMFTEQARHPGGSARLRYTRQAACGGAARGTPCFRREQLRAASAARFALTCRLALPRRGLPGAQGSSIWVRYTKLARYFLPSYSPLERLLVALNYYQNFLFTCPFLNTPLLLRLAHEVSGPAACAAKRGAACFAFCPLLTLRRPQILLGTAFPIEGVQKNVLGGAILLQLLYDWHWNVKLRASWVSYRKKIKALKGGKKQT